MLFLLITNIKIQVVFGFNINKLITVTIKCEFVEN